MKNISSFLQKNRAFLGAFTLGAVFFVALFFVHNQHWLRLHSWVWMEETRKFVSAQEFVSDPILDRFETVSGKGRYLFVGFTDMLPDFSQEQALSAVRINGELRGTGALWGVYIGRVYKGFGLSISINDESTLKNGDVLTISPEDWKKAGLPFVLPQKIALTIAPGYSLSATRNQEKMGVYDVVITGNPDTQENLELWQYQQEDGWCSAEQKKNNLEKMSFQEQKTASGWTVELARQPRLQKTCLLARLGTAMTMLDSFDISEPKADFIVNEVEPKTLKTRLTVNFATDMYFDRYFAEEKDLIAYRKHQKELFLQHVRVDGKMPDPETTYFTAREMQIFLPIVSHHSYTTEIDAIADVWGQKMPKQTHTFSLGDVRYLNVFLEPKATMYDVRHLPSINISSVGLQNKTLGLRLCSVSENEYMRLEGVLHGKKTSVDFGNADSSLLTSVQKACKDANVVLTEGFQTPSLVSLFGTGMQNGYFVLLVQNAKDLALPQYAQKVQPLLFALADSHITAKISHNGDALFLVTDIQSGQPVPGMEIVVRKNKTRQSSILSGEAYIRSDAFEKPLALGKTNAQGVLEVSMSKKLKENGYFLSFANWLMDRSEFEGYEKDVIRTDGYPSLFITAQSGTKSSYVVSTWNSGIADWNLGYYPAQNDGTAWGGDALVEKNKKLGFIFPDRRLYLPGETVHLQAMIREGVGEKALRVPREKSVFFMQVADSEGKVVLDATGATNAFGSIFTAFDIPAEARMGTYTATVFTGTKKTPITLATSVFDVQVFKNPSFHTDIRLTASGMDGGYIRAERALVGADAWGYPQYSYTGTFDISATLSAAYFNGALAANHTYYYRLMRQVDYDQEEEGCYYGCNFETPKEIVTEGEGVLDAQGKAILVIPVQFRSDAQNYRYILEASVTHPETRETIAASQSLIAKIPDALRDWYWSYGSARLTADKVFVQAQTPVRLEITTGKKTAWPLMLDGKYRVSVVRRAYTTRTIADVRGDMRPLNSAQDIVVYSGAVTRTKDWSLTASGIALNLVLPEPGEYRVEFEGRGAENTITALYAWGKNPGDIPVLDDDRLRVITEKNSYTIGETAKMFVSLPFTGSHVFITQEKGGVLAKQYVSVPGNTYYWETKVDESFIPNAYVGVVAIPSWTASGSDTPHYKVGYAEIVVDKSDKVLQVAVKSDKNTYLPRERVHLEAQVTDKYKHPSVAELSFVVVDDSVVSLLGKPDLNMIPKFYPKIAFQTQTALTNLGMIRNYYFSRVGTVGGGGGEKGGDDGILKRNRFINTAFYTGAVVTDANGKALLDFELPDSITNWRIMAVAHSKDSRFGVGESLIQARKDVVVQELLPLMVRPGDTFSLGAHVFNFTNVPQKLTLGGLWNTQSLTASGIEVQPQGQNAYFWNVQVPSLATGMLPYELRAQGTKKTLQDTLQKEIPVKMPPTVVTRVKSDVLVSAGADITLAIPEGTLLSGSSLSLTLSNNPLAGIAEIAKSLAAYPHGCIEQTTSATFPNVVLQKIAHLVPGLSVDLPELQKNTRAGVARIAQMQQQDGGFAYWPGETLSNARITPYVLRTLVAMRALGADIPSTMTENAARFLAEKARQSQTGFDRDEASEVAWALASAGGAWKKDAQKLFALLAPQKLNTHGLVAYLWTAHLLGKTPAESWAEKVYRETDPKKLQETYYYWNSRSDRALLASLFLAQDKREKAQTLIRELSLYDWENYQYSTQEKNNAFAAFATALEKYGSAQTAHISVRLADSALSFESNLSPEISFLQKNLPIETLVRKNSVQVHVDVQSVDPVYITAVAHLLPQNTTALRPSCSQKELALTRTITALKREGGTYVRTEKPILLDTSSAYSSEPLVLDKDATYEVRISGKSGNFPRATDFAIEDFLPASFEPLRTDFQTSETLLMSGEQNIAASSAFSHNEQKPDMMFWHSAGISGDFAVTYLVRPKFAGTFLYPPVSAYYMYHPEDECHTSYRTLQVR